MSALLDTHILLWVLDDSERLGPATAEWLRQQPRVWVSAASLWEIAIKRSLGKLTVPDNLLDLIAEAGLEWLALQPEHVWSTTGVTGLPHRDPFDRLLLAQSHLERLTFVTADAALLGADIRPELRLRDARS